MAPDYLDLFQTAARGHKIKTGTISVNADERIISPFGFFEAKDYPCKR